MRDPLPEPRAERVYAALLRLLPREFLDDVGDDMLDLFRDQLRDARQRTGIRGVAMKWIRTIPDILLTSLREHATVINTAHRSRSHLSHDPMHQTITQDLRFAARVLRKNLLFTGVAVAVIALGTGAVSTIFSVANAAVLHPLPGVDDPSRIATIDRIRDQKGGTRSASYPYFERMADRARTIRVAAWTYVNITVSTGGEGTAAFADLVSGNYFDVLGVKPAMGRFFAGDETRLRNTYPVVVLSHEFWQRRFSSDSSVLGKTVLINGRQFSVIGVAPARFAGLYPALRTDAWLPLMMQTAVKQGDLLSNRRAYWLELFGRLAPGASRTAAQAELIGLTHQMDEPAEMADFTVQLSRASGLPSDASGAVIGFFGVLLVVAGLVLLIASVNVASMLLARAVARRREIAVRVALGAGRARLVMQLLTESVLLFVMGGAAGLGVAVYGTKLLSRISIPQDVPLVLDISPDVRVFVVTLLVALITGVIFGLVPALQATRVDIATVLRADGAGSGQRRSKLRGALVIGQVAASLLLLTTAGLFFRALDRGRRVDIGFDPSHVEIGGITLSTSGYDSTEARQFLANFRARLAALPGVTNVAFAAQLPLSGNRSSEDITVAGYVPPTSKRDNRETVLDDVVDEGYFGAMGTPVIRGRGFVAGDDGRSAGVAVVNEAFARHYWPNQDAIGRSIRLDSTNITIVGVARDSRFRDLGDVPEPVLFLPLAQHSRSNVMVVVRGAGDPSLLAPDIQREYHALDPNLPAILASTLRESIEVGLLPQRVAVMVTGALGVAGMLLAAIGLYGVVAFGAAQRTREIAVRIALGAERRSVLALVVGDGMRLVGVGCVVGLVLAVGATRALAPFLFGVDPLDAVAFVGTVVALGGATFVASYVPARRAARIDPMEALRQE